MAGRRGRPPNACGPEDEKPSFGTRRQVGHVLRIKAMETATMAWGMPGTTELIIIAVIALVIFGRRLPDVARSVGKSIVEFKKGIRDVKDDISVQSRIESTTSSKLENKPEPQSDAPAPPEPPKESTPTSS